MANDAMRLDHAVGGSVFGTDPDGYDAGRIGYPPALFDAIRDHATAPITAIVEAGPGTGLATRSLLSFGPRRLVAVEPDPVLADRLRDTFFGSCVEVCNQSFPDAKIEGSFDLGAAASSFHWMNADAAFARFRALLRPGATLALWWSSYRQAGIGDPLADALVPLLADYHLPPSEGTAGHYSLDVEHHRSAMAGAGFGDLANHVFKRERTLSRAELRALYDSYSFVRALGPAARQDLLDRIDRIAQTRFGDRVPNIVVSALYLGTAP